METTLFLKGVLIGFLISTPVGPIAVLCINRTLNEGRIHGIVSGLGAATADAIYGLIAASGLTFISNFLVQEQIWLRLLGGLFLCYMGVKIFRSKLVQRVASGEGASYFSNYISASLLTLANPGTLIAFAAVFSGLGIVKVRVHYASAGLLVGGVFIGSGLWWFILNIIAGVFLGQLDYFKLSWLNKISGTIISGFGLFVLLSLAI
jgi:threonine/homoserine/homoserine lactone efflux protein